MSRGRPYFFWNGIRSDEMHIIVEELAPIRKPEKRRSTSIVDGRDGDQSEELGYEAYDKTITFGMTEVSEPLIDALFGWLDGKGTLVTSTEKTKKYMGEIFDGIDLRRLVRFRKGSVTIHVQPFKYELDEESRIWTTGEKRLYIPSSGNKPSAPIITVRGTEDVTFYVDGEEAFTLNLDSNISEITVDSQKEEAYQGEADNYRNRRMEGEFPKLDPGDHMLTWVGTASSILVEPGSRWI